MKFSLSYEARKKRIKNLPELVNDMMQAKLKKDVKGLINEFKNGLRKNSLGLEKLASLTIEGKRNKGYSKPENPLYGKGDDRKNDSYINLFKIQKVKGGYKVTPSKRMHWSKKISLKDLFTIHEYGTKIVKKDGTIVIIPPRPALLYAYRKWMSKRKADKRETSRQVKSAINGYISNADYGRYRTFIGKNKVTEKGLSEE